MTSSADPRHISASSDTHALLGAAQIRALAADVGITPTKTLGQNFVIDANTIRRIVGAAHLSGEETVLEVGPGLGSLTLGLLDAAQKVIAVEIDERLAHRLPQTIEHMRPEAYQNLTVISQDALTVQHLPAAPDALVANLPYNVAVPVVLYLLERFNSITSGLVMVQDEVADRMAARPGTKLYGVPSVKGAWYGTLTKSGVIGMNVFWPAPKIRSGLVAFQRGPERGSEALRCATFAAIDAAFAQRRKTLRAALAGWAGSPVASEEILRAAGVDPQRRGETLVIDEFIAIARVKESLES